MSTELKKGLDYIVLNSDTHGNEHNETDIKRLRQNSIQVLSLTADYINQTPEVIAWLNAGDMDDTYCASRNCTKDGKLDIKKFLQGNAELYKAVNEAYKKCRLKPEQKIAVLGNHDIPMTFLQTVDNCTLIGADIAVIAKGYMQTTKGRFQPKTQIAKAGRINDIPVIGAMNTFEAPASMPEQAMQEIYPHLILPHTEFYMHYPEFYAEELKGKYYFLGHKGLIDKQDKHRKEEDAIHKIAANSIASFEGHFHDACANNAGTTIRFRSGTDYVLIIGIEKETGQPAHIIRKKII